MTALAMKKPDPMEMTPDELLRYVDRSNPEVRALALFLEAHRAFVKRLKAGAVGLPEKRHES